MAILYMVPANEISGGPELAHQKCIESLSMERLP